MTLNLHPDCKKRLIEVVAKGLPAIIADHGMFINRTSYIIGLLEADDVVPKNGKLAKQLADYIDEFPIIDFISDTLSVELRDLDKYQKEPASIKLTELEGYADPKATAQRLVDQLETLPWKYALTIKLPEKISSALRPYIDSQQKFSDYIRVVLPTEEFRSEFPFISANKKRNERIHFSRSIFGLLGNEDPKWDDDSIFLQINAEGFIGLYGTTAPAYKSLATLRAFCGLAIALRLLQVKYTYSSTPPKSNVYVHKYGKQWEIDGKFELDDPYSKVLSDLKLYDALEKLDAGEKRTRWILTTFREIELVFSNAQKAEKIILAAQWLFDSYTGNDELLSFVQTMVVLEILLGDKETADEIGLGELLRNRCAYLIGKSHKERNDLLKEFKEIYRVRSQIVHRGKSKLTGDERVLFNKLRQMCRSVIQEEVNLLKADSELSK